MTRPIDEAERCVLGSMLRDNSVIAEVAQILRPDYFRSAGHQRLFAAALELFEAGQPVDLVTLADLLFKQQKIDEVGGYSAIAELWDVTATAANVEHHPRIVRDSALLRELRRVAAEIEAEARDQAGPPEQLLDAAERRILDIARQGVAGQARPLSHFVDRAYDGIDSRLARGGRTTGLSTGLIDLDRLTAGLHGGEFVVVAARPSVGKTTFGLTLAYAASAAGAPAFFASLEQSGVELAERLLANLGHVDGHRVRCGSLGEEELARLRRAGDPLRQMGIFVDESPGSGRCGSQRTPGG